METNLDDEGRLLSMILESEQNVRFAAICDVDGKILWNSQHNNVKNILTLDETKASLKRAIKSWRSRDELSHKIGKSRYTITAYEKIKRITIPLQDNHILFVSIDNEGEKPDNIQNITNIIDWVTKHPTAA